MKVVVHDASILIDLALSHTVEAWFSGGVETWTTNLIYPGEITRPDQRSLFEAYVAAGKLQVQQFTEVGIDELVAAQNRLGRGLSLADVSAFILAKQLGDVAVLATGDGMLRATAKREKIRACGILGLFDAMLVANNGCDAVLPFQVAIEKLKGLMELPECRLPADRCAEKIKLWSQNKVR